MTTPAELSRIDVVFPDGLIFQSYVRLLSIPYAVQRNRAHYPDLSHCPCHMLRMDAEADFAAEFRAMSPLDRLAALRALPWGQDIAMWLLPADHRMTISDALARRDLDLNARPFTYVADDWASARLGVVE
jgi:hypothetical protein